MKIHGPLAEEADRRSGSTQEPSAGISRPATADVRVAATVRSGDPSGPARPASRGRATTGRRIGAPCQAAPHHRALARRPPTVIKHLRGRRKVHAWGRLLARGLFGGLPICVVVLVMYGKALPYTVVRFIWRGVSKYFLVRADQLFAQLIRQRRQVRYGHVPTVMHGRIEKTSCRRPARGYSSAEAPPSTVALAAGSIGVIRRFPNRTAIDSSDPSDPSGHRKLRSSRGARRHPTHRIAMRSFAVRPASPPRCRKACHQS